jgi:hypothetical protein
MDVLVSSARLVPTKNLHETNLQWRVASLEGGRRPLRESWRDRQKFGFGFVLVRIILRCFSATHTAAIATR